MARFDSEREFIEHFDDRYQKVLAPVMLDIEEETQGTRSGASSWSTPAQVERFAAETRLTPGHLLLEVGCGTGWVGVQVAARTGANVVLTDLPYPAVSLARHTAAESDVFAVLTVADATRLPFVDGTFDAIVHSDVMCCLSGKQAVFDECRRLLKPSGRMVFTALITDESLPFDVATNRMQAGSEFVASEKPYAEMLSSSSFGFTVEDWTGEFVAMAERLDRARASRAEGLVDLFGAEEAEGLLERPRWNIEAVDDGVLVRRFYIAEPV